MEAMLLHHTKKDLVGIATRYAADAGKPRPDRLCHRLKDAMICWMCDHVPEFPFEFPAVPIYVPKPPGQKPGNDDWTLDWDWEVEDLVDYAE
jgi:hypothetical protein